MNLLKSTTLICALALVPFVGCGSDDKKDTTPTPEASACGNGVIDGDEECDGTEVPTCAEATMMTGSTGTVTCSSSCVAVTSGCEAPGGTGGTSSGGSSGMGAMAGMGANVGTGGTTPGDASADSSGDGAPAADGAAEAAADATTD